MGAIEQKGWRPLLYNETLIIRYVDSKSREVLVFPPYFPWEDKSRNFLVEFQDIRGTNGIPQFMRPELVNRIPIPGVDFKPLAVLFHWRYCGYHLEKFVNNEELRVYLSYQSV